jgi:hypothetical protein
LELPIDQLAFAITGSVSYEIWDKLYLGISARNLESSLNFDLATAAGIPSFPTPDFDVTSGMIGPTFEIDHRDDQFAPRRGYELSGEAMFSSAQSNDRYKFHREQLSFNYFLPVTCR